MQWYLEDLWSYVERSTDSFQPVAMANHRPPLLSNLFPKKMRQGPNFRGFWSVSPTKRLAEMGPVNVVSGFISGYTVPYCNCVDL